MREDLGLSSTRPTLPSAQAQNAVAHPAAIHPTAACCCCCLADATHFPVTVVWVRNLSPVTNGSLGCAARLHSIVHYFSEEQISSPQLNVFYGCMWEMLLESFWLCYCGGRKCGKPGSCPSAIEWFGLVHVRLEMKSKVRKSFCEAVYHFW